jgi:hypothetical protein
VSVAAPTKGARRQEATQGRGLSRVQGRVWWRSERNRDAQTIRPSAVCGEVGTKVSCKDGRTDGCS